MRSFGLAKGNHATKLEQNQVLPHNLLGLGIPLNFIDTGLQSRLLSVLAPKDRGLQVRTFLRDQPWAKSAWAHMAERVN